MLQIEYVDRIPEYTESTNNYYPCKWTPNYIYASHNFPGLHKTCNAFTLQSSVYSHIMVYTLWELHTLRSTAHNANDHHEAFTKHDDDNNSKNKYSIAVVIGQSLPDLKMIKGANRPSYIER